MEEEALQLTLVFLKLVFNKLMSQTDCTSIRITIDCIDCITLVHNLITTHDFGVPARFQ